MTAPVDQYQRALRTESAQIEQVETGGSQESAGVRLAERTAQSRQVIQHVAE
jgi:hypothetical protein